MTDDITKLEGFLKGLNKPVLSSDSRMKMRGNLMKSILAEKKVESFVREAAGEVSLSGVHKALLKEKIVGYAASRSNFFWGYFLSFGKKFAGIATLASFLFGIFGFAFVDINVASADSFTYVESVSGDATVLRDGKEISATQNMRLQQGDTVVTDDDSSISIKFLDQSVARLGGETTVALNEMVASGDDSAFTRVEMEVKNGVVWSRVLNLINSESSFKVKMGDLYAYAKKAAFNVSKENEKATVEVYSSVVSVGSADNVDKKIKSGEGVVANDVDNSKSAFAMVTHVKDDNWVQQNLNEDKVHIAKVEAESAQALENAAGVLPESPLYAFKDIKAGVVKLFTFDDVASEKVDLEEADRKFVEWSVLLKDGKVDSSKAEDIFNNYIKQVEAFNDLVKNVRDSGDIEYSEELKAYLDQKIKDRQNDLKTVLPASPLYTAKNYLFQAEVAVTDDVAEKAVVKQVQATQKLSEAQDLVDAGDTQTAAQAIGDYAKTVSEVKQEVIALPEDSKATVATQIVDAIKDDKDLLSGIKQSSTGEDVSAVAGQVEKLVVDPMAANLTGQVSSVVAAENKELSTAVITPSQRTGDYGVPVVGTGDSEKPLDPLLDLSR